MANTVDPVPDVVGTRWLKTYVWIYRYAQEHGCLPTMNEVAAAMGLASRNAVLSALTLAEANGYCDRVGRRLYRGYVDLLLAPDGRPIPDGEHPLRMKDTIEALRKKIRLHEKFHDRYVAFEAAMLDDDSPWFDAMPEAVQSAYERLADARSKLT